MRLHPFHQVTDKRKSHHSGDTDKKKSHHSEQAYIPIDFWRTRIMQYTPSILLE